MAATAEGAGTAGNRTVLKRRPVLYWMFWAGPPLALMAAIFWMGGDRGASGQSQGLLSHVLAWLAPGLYAHLSAEQLEAFNVGLRKTAHFLTYGLLAALDARALHGARDGAGIREAQCAWAAAVSWAAVDEFHQSFFPSRGGSPYDVLLDASGAATAVLLYLVWARRSRKSC